MNGPAGEAAWRCRGVSVAPMTLDDVPRVVEIDTLSFPLPWSAASYRYELMQNSNSHFLVALADGPAPGQAAPAPSRLAGLLGRLGVAPGPRAAAHARNVVGYCGFWYILDEAHVSTIAVHPDWRGQGVGECLFVALLERALDLGAATATLEVRVSNAHAQHLYRKYQFEVVGRRKRYYRDNGEDALLMTAELRPGYREQLRRTLAAGVEHTREDTKRT